MTEDPAATIARLRARVAELEAALAAARRAATHDPLTGLLNRAGLVDAWTCRPRAAVWRLAVVDLDGFKRVNDQHGHAAGDVVLVAVAALLRGLPLAARLGGDEFAVLVHPTDVLPARVVAVLPGGSTVSVATSTGFAPAGGDLSVVLARADAAMYRAKTAGEAAAVYDPCRDDRPMVPRPRVRLRDTSRGAFPDVLPGVAPTGS